MLPLDEHSVGTAGSKTHCLFQSSPNKGNSEFHWGCSPQTKVLLWDPLPSQLPGSCKGTAGLMAPDISDISLCPSGHPKKCWEAVHSLWVSSLRTDMCGGKGYQALEVRHGCCQMAFILQDPGGFVPEQETLISKKWIPIFVYMSHSLLPASMKTTQDAFLPPSHDRRNNQDRSSSHLYELDIESPCLNPSRLKTLHYLHWSFMKNFKICS